MYRSNRVGLMRTLGPRILSSALTSSTRAWAAAGRRAARRHSPGAACALPSTAASAACTDARCGVFCCQTSPSRSSAAAGVAASSSGCTTAGGTRSNSSAGANAAVPGQARSAARPAEPQVFLRHRQCLIKADLLTDHTVFKAVGQFRAKRDHGIAVSVAQKAGIPRCLGKLPFRQPHHKHGLGFGAGACGQRW